jgi:peptidoglycan hydrolase CwlO-like protein
MKKVLILTALIAMPLMHDAYSAVSKPSWWSRVMGWLSGSSSNQHTELLDMQEKINAYIKDMDQKAKAIPSKYQDYHQDLGKKAKEFAEAFAVWKTWSQDNVAKEREKIKAKKAVLKEAIRKLKVQMSANESDMGRMGTLDRLNEVNKPLQEKIDQFQSDIKNFDTEIEAIKSNVKEQQQHFTVYVQDLNIKLIGINVKVLDYKVSHKH